MEFNYSVKEKRNLFSHELWACGDKGSPSFNSNNTSYSLSTDYSINGSTCAKISVPLNTSSYLGYKITSINDLIGQTLRFSCDIQANIDTKIVLLVIDSNSTNNQNIELIIPNNDDLHSVTLATPILETTPGVYCRISVNNITSKTQEVYTDNWCLEEV